MRVKSETQPERERLQRWLVDGEVPTRPSAPHRLASTVVVQQLAGPFERALAEVDHAWPTGALDRIKRAHRIALVRGTVQLALGERVLALLAAHRLRALPLKGLAVAGWLYDSVADRPMHDLDVLVLDDFAAAERVLREAGLIEEERDQHATVYRDPVSRELIELHRALTSCAPLFPVDTGKVWKRASGGRPSPEDLAVQLAVHAAFQHGLSLPLGRWLDFRRLFERAAPRDELLLEVAAAQGALGCLAAALELARALAGAPVPDALREELARRLRPGFRRWLDQTLRDPLILLSPTPLARVRWELAAGARWTLLKGTLVPTVRSGGLVRRAFRIGRRVWQDR